jgi:hypothetical protein
MTGFHHSGELEHAVGKCGLAVVDMGDDAEVADARRVCGTGGYAKTRHL